MARIPWVLTDPFSSDSVELEINPTEADSLPLNKTITYQTTSSPDGRTLVFQGRDQAIQMTFTGNVLTEDQYNLFVTWFHKQNQITITDDLGRSYNVIITTWVPHRAKTSLQFPWRHSYTMTVTVI